MNFFTMRTDVFKARIKTEIRYLHLLPSVVLSMWRRLGIFPYFAQKSPLLRVINSNYLHFSIILSFPRRPVAFVRILAENPCL